LILLLPFSSPPRKDVHDAQHARDRALPFRRRCRDEINRPRYAGPPNRPIAAARRYATRCCCQRVSAIFSHLSLLALIRLPSDAMLLCDAFFFDMPPSLSPTPHRGAFICR